MLSFIKEKFFKQGFLLYSYAINLCFFTLDLMPHFVRNLAFRSLFLKYGSGVMIDYKTFFRYTRKIKIGDNVSINRGCEFFTSANLGSVINIGNNVVFSPNVKIYGAGHNYRHLQLPDTSGDVNIEDNVWICGNSVILQGVTLGEGCIVLPNSVVTKDMPPYTVVAGMPAETIKKRVLHE